MAMRKYNPFDELEEMFDRMSRQFEDMPRRGMMGMSQIMVDVEERDEDFVLTADLPGFTREDIHLSVLGDRVTIKAEHEESMDEEDTNYVRKERRHRTVRRSLHLPEDVDGDKAKASYKNGVLSVTLPKMEGTSKGKQINID
ncbi:MULTISPECIES: Hsp20/alpha crystallin family protein [unclassified Haladaptatus]|uniref:Hsp20/alpha crystallin family protein n=1 Tax=unclassified Haladaptatus TaxID=2622732 RepID=UPI0023E784FC|nr:MULTISPECIES: Hsp20/alpha crystallin family protein [unclassified Haladaptatus]